MSMFSGLTSGFSNQVSGLTSYFGKKPEDGAPDGEQPPNPATPEQEKPVALPVAPEPEVLLDAEGKPLSPTKGGGKMEMLTNVKSQMSSWLGAGGDLISTAGGGLIQAVKSRTSGEEIFIMYRVQAPNINDAFAVAQPQLDDAQPKPKPNDAQAPPTFGSIQQDVQTVQDTLLRICEATRAFGPEYRSDPKVAHFLDALTTANQNLVASLKSINQRTIQAVNSIKTAELKEEELINRAQYPKDGTNYRKLRKSLAKRSERTLSEFDISVTAREGKEATAKHRLVTALAKYKKESATAQILKDMRISLASALKDNQKEREQADRQKFKQAKAKTRQRRALNAVKTRADLLAGYVSDDDSDASDVSNSDASDDDQMSLD